MIEGLEFYEPTHTYKYEGVIVPGVTSLLKVLGGYEGIPAEILTAASARGVAVHRAVELYNTHCLDWSSLDDELLPYMEAYLRFMQDCKPIILNAELRVHHRTLNYAGTMDIRAILKKRIATIDLKATWQMQPTTGPQTAGYKEAYNSRAKKDDLIRDRYGLQLKRDGTYSLYPYNDTNDLQVFYACKTVNDWKRSNTKNEQ